MKGAFGIWRLKINAFRGVRMFFNSWKTECFGLVSGVKVRLVKYFIDGKTYVCLTNDLSITRLQVKNHYASRWRVEESFKRLKSNLKLEKSHSLTPELFYQEVEARVLLDTITLLMKLEKDSYIITLDSRVKFLVDQIHLLSRKNASIPLIRKLNFYNVHNNHTNRDTSTKDYLTPYAQKEKTFSG